MQKIRIDHEQIAPGDCGKLAPLIPFVEPCRPDRIVGAGDDRFGSRRKHIFDADGWRRRGERSEDVLAAAQADRRRNQMPSAHRIERLMPDFVEH